MDNKYVIVSVHRIETAILFPPVVQHSQALNKRLLEPLAAGFWKIGTDGRVKAWGKSVSLGVESRDGDAELIEFTLGMLLGNGTRVESVGGNVSGRMERK